MKLTTKCAANEINVKTYLHFWLSDADYTHCFAKDSEFRATKIDVFQKFRYI